MRVGDVGTDDGDIGARAAHVEGEQALLLTHPSCPEQAARRTGQQQVHGVTPGMLDAGGTCRTLHDLDTCTGTGRRQPLQVLLHQWAHHRVQRRRHTALVLAVDRQHVGRARDEELTGEPLCDRLLDTQLLVIVEEREQQVDGHCGRGELLQSLEQARQVLVVQSLQRLCLGRQPAVDLETQLCGHEREDWCGLQLVQLASRLTADGEHVGQATVTDVSRAYAFAFEYRIGGHGGTVGDVQRFGIEAQFADTADDGLLRRMRCGQDLVQSQLPGIVQQQEISERSARVYTEICHQRILQR